MKDTKKWRNKFDIYDKYRLAEYFEAQAREGWILESYSGSKFLFRRGEPQNLHYCVVFYPDGITYDTKPTESQKILYDFCARAGWKLVTAKGYIQVFCNEAEKPIPIETEPEVELENIQKFYKAYQRTQRGLFFAALLSIITRLESFLEGNQNKGDTLFDIAFLFAWGILILIILIEYSVYRVWYHKAKQVIAAGMEIPKVGSNRIRLVIERTFVVIALLTMMLSIIMIDSKLLVAIFVAAPVTFFGVGLKKLLEGEWFDGYNAQTKYLFFVLVSSAVAVIALGILAAYALNS